MNKKDRMVTSIELMHYNNFASVQSFRAMRHSDEIGIRCPEKRECCYDFSRKVRDLIDSVLYDILTRGKAERIFLAEDGDSDLPCFNVFQKKSGGRYSAQKVLFSKKVAFHCKDFGIKRREIKRLVRKLRRSSSFPVDGDFIRKNNLRNEMADRAGKTVSWTYSAPSSFTDPCILLNECDQKILSVKVCKSLEKELNMFFLEGGINAEVIVPCYSVEELAKAKKQFIEGVIGVKEFSAIVFAR